MNSNQMEILEANQTSKCIATDLNALVSFEAEIPEALYKAMKSFISENPDWDQYKVMTSAISTFLFQNGCEDRAVIEKYLNNLFIRSYF